MSTLHDPDPEFERRLAALLLDVLIRAGLLLALAVLCFQVFSPFLSLMTWALILAVTLYPLHQSVAAKIGGRQGLAATLLVLLGVVVVIVPTAALMNSLGDSMPDDRRWRDSSRTTRTRGRASADTVGKRCSRESATKRRWHVIVAGWHRSSRVRCDATPPVDRSERPSATISLFTAVKSSHSRTSGATSSIGTSSRR